MSNADKGPIVVTRGVASAAHRAARHGRTGEVLGEVLSLIDDPRWTVDHVRLAAGQRSAPAHRHSHTDECVLVLSGRVELRGQELLEAGTSRGSGRAKRRCTSSSRRRARSCSSCASPTRTT